MEKTVQYRTVIQCPYCGFKVTEKMPRLRKVMHYTCPACGETTEAADAACCIFCQLGSLPCPDRQKQALEGDQA